MKKENPLTNKIKPAERLANVTEYYFSRKLKEVAQMNAEGKNVISLGIGVSIILLYCNSLLFVILIPPNLC